MSLRPAYSWRSTYSLSLDIITYTEDEVSEANQRTLGIEVPQSKLSSHVRSTSRRQNKASMPER